MIATTPYKMIARQLGLGNVVPFLGAGVNFAQRTTSGQKYSPGCGFLPGGGELAECLWAEANLRPGDVHQLADLSLAASCAEVAGGRLPLRDYLRQTFDAAASGKPTTLHTLLASVSRPMLIMTTNYDTLTEQAFHEANRKFLVVSHADDSGAHAASLVIREGIAGEPEVALPNQRSLNPSETTIIYKIHGSVQPGKADLDGYVITEDDYIAAFGRTSVDTGFPPELHLHLQSRHVLFLGYGLQDWNVRILLNRLSSLRASAAATRKHWAIQHRPDAFESKLWEGRGVNIYDVDIGAFAAQLNQELKAP